MEIDVFPKENEGFHKVHFRFSIFRKMKNLESQFFDDNHNFWINHNFSISINCDDLPKIVILIKNLEFREGGFINF